MKSDGRRAALGLLVVVVLAVVGGAYLLLGRDNGGAGMPSSNTRNDRPVWVADYAVEDLRAAWESQEETAPDRISVVRDPSEGSVLRYEIRDGETASITENERVETRDPRLDAGGLWRGRHGETWWFGWRFKLSEQFENTSNFNFLTQWKGWNPDTGPPAFALGAGKETLRLKAGTQADQVLVWKGPATDEVKGRWQDIIVHMKVSHDEDGFVEIWSGPAGRPVRQTNLMGGGTRWTGRTLHEGYADQYQIFKQGIYRDVAAFAGTSEHLVKTPRIGRSYEAVAPR